MPDVSAFIRSYLRCVGILGWSFFRISRVFTTTSGEAILAFKSAFLVGSVGFCNIAAACFGL